jgi:hypothetical protein
MKPLETSPPLILAFGGCVDGGENSIKSPNWWKKERGNSNGIREASRLWRALSIRQTDLLTLLKHLHARVEALQQL